jgi:pimeloyl-ACP methyl ester carboxylesterase
VGRFIRVTVGALLGFVVAGCAGTSPADDRDSSGPGSPSAIANSPKRVLSAAERCGGQASADVTPVQIALGQDTLYGLRAGKGARGVVLIHGSGQRGVCVWQQEIPALAAQGFRTLAVDHRCVGQSTCVAGAVDLVADIAAAAQHLRAAGATTVSVIGASAGTAQVIVAAAAAGPPITAVVALSPGRLDDDVRRTGERPRTARQAAPEIRVPMLYVVAADDRLSSVAAVQELNEATPRPYRGLLSRPDGGHAQELLYSGGTASAEPAGPVYDAVLAFLRRHSAA